MCTHSRRGRALKNFEKKIFFEKIKSCPEFDKIHKYIKILKKIFDRKILKNYKSGFTGEN